jgi:hypothetical protein
MSEKISRTESIERQGLAPWVVIAITAHVGLIALLGGLKAVSLVRAAPQVDQEAIEIDLVDLTELTTAQIEPEESAVSASRDSISDTSLTNARPHGDQRALVGGEIKTAPTRAESVSKDGSDAGRGIPSLGNTSAESEHAPKGDRPRHGLSFKLPEGSFGAPGEGGPTGAVSLQRTDSGEGVRRAMARDQADRDRSVGLGPGSAVASAAESAIREVGAPDGWAIFDVTLNGQGIVSAVKLVDAATAGWQKAAPAIQSKLASNAVKLPASFGGARVRVKLMAKFQLPNGQKDQVELIKPLERVGEPGVTPEPNATPAYTHWWDGLGPAHDTRVMPTRPSGVAESLPAGSHHLMLPLVKFDPANLGANRSFIVGASVLDVAPL